MALVQEDSDFVKRHLGNWLTEQGFGKPSAVYELKLRVGMVRIEEELKHQRELMRQGFDHVWVLRLKEQTAIPPAGPR